MKVKVTLTVAGCSTFCYMKVDHFTKEIHQSLKVASPRFKVTAYKVIGKVEGPLLTFEETLQWIKSAVIISADTTCTMANIGVEYHNIPDKHWKIGVFL